MVGRIILTVLVIMIVFFVLSQVEQRFAPNRQADLAVEQVEENGAREELRIEQHMQNWIEPILYCSMFGLFIWIWYEPVKKLVKKEVSPTVSIHENG